MPSLYELSRKYIWGKEEAHSLIASEVPEMTPPSELSNLMLRNIALSEPLILKTFLKKNKDIVRNWHKIKNPDDKKEVPKEVSRLLYNFDKKQRVKQKMFTAGLCSDVYGTGFIELKYNERKNANASNMPNSTFVGIELLNPEHITKIDFHPSKKDDLLYFIYQNPEDRKHLGEVYIHPSRVLPYITNKLPFSNFGISKVKTAANILRSKMNADKSAGNILEFMAGMYDIKIEGMQPEQEKKAKETVKKHPAYLIHDEDYEVKVEKPGKVEPASFYDYFYTNIAAVSEMPKNMLTGADTGNVTGSEVGASNYYSDCADIQDVIVSPILEIIYGLYLKNFKLDWNYDINWNIIYVDELSEAKILQTRAYSATQGYIAGILKSIEARQILNEGTIHLVGDYERPPEEKVSNPNIEPQGDPKKPDKAKNIKFITQQQIDLIEKIRRNGLKELREQEKRVVDANK